MSYGMQEFLQDIKDNRVDPGSAYDALCSVDRTKLARVWERLNQIRAISVRGNSERKRQFRGTLSRHVGAMFERLVRVLLEDCRVVTVGTNVRSTISEIDVLLVYEPLATVVPMFRDSGTHSLGEAKCVKGGLKTEWVNEMAGFMPVHSCMLGVLFTAAPPRKLGSEARHAISLHAARGLKIVPFGPTQFQRVLSGENVLKVLNDQYISVASLSTDLHI